MSRKVEAAASTLVPVALVGLVAWKFGWPTAAIFIMIAVAVGTAAVVVIIDA